MPLLKPSDPPKKNTKPAAKTLTSKKGGAPGGKSAPKGKAHHPSPPPPREPSWWENLSPERKLDVLGIGLSFVGIVLFLGLLSANRSPAIGGLIFIFAQLFGWGVYI